MPFFTPKTPFLSVFAIFLGLIVIPLRAEAFDQPTILNASDVLPDVKLQGPNYTINETVKNDGIMNIYSLKVGDNIYSIEGTDLLLYRLRELDALISLQMRENDEAFKSSAGTAAKAPVEGVKGLVTDPVDTVSRAASGVGSFFESIGHAAVNRSNEEEDTALETAAGFGVARRQWASQYGLDPYTSFDPVKDKLRDLAWASAGGGVAVTVGFAAIPGAAGTAVSLTKSTETFNNLVYLKSPAELEEVNEERLREMGVDDELIRSFLRHPEFTPTHETEIINALFATTIENRSAFLSTAILADDEPSAFFMMRWAQMYATYHVSIEPLQKFMTLGKIPVGLRADGVLIFVAPIDHLAWTQINAENHLAKMEELKTIPGVTRGKFWVAGSITPLARENLEALHWAVKDSAGKALGVR